MGYARHYRIELLPRQSAGRTAFTDHPGAPAYRDYCRGPFSPHRRLGRKDLRVSYNQSVSEAFQTAKSFVFVNDKLRADVVVDKELCAKLDETDSDFMGDSLISYRLEE